jgi:hypothetical protein
MPCPRRAKDEARRLNLYVSTTAWAKLRFTRQEGITAPTVLGSWNPQACTTSGTERCRSSCHYPAAPTGEQRHSRRMDCLRSRFGPTQDNKEQNRNPQEGQQATTYIAPKQEVVVVAMSRNGPSQPQYEQPIPGRI